MGFGPMSARSKLVSISKSATLMSIVIIVSLVMLLERHFSLMSARQDHFIMQIELERVRSELDNIRGLPSGSLLNTTSQNIIDCNAVVEVAQKEWESSNSTDRCGQTILMLQSKMEKLQRAYDRQMEEKVNMADMMKECEGSNIWSEKTLTEQAIKAAAEAIEKCGSVSEGTGGLQFFNSTAESKLYRCEATNEDLTRYLNYTARALCPDDWFFVQNLIYVKNCYCLPKRTCFARTAPNGGEPIPFPQSLWDPDALINANVRWNLHSYDSFDNIIARKVGDCRDCFNLTLEATRWYKERHGAIRLEKVVNMKKGALRIGLDAGGGTGSFAAKMAMYNCTIITTAMNIETLSDARAGLPYMETIALRGLLPLHLPHKARLPFFDNTLDVVHTMNSIKYFSLTEFEELIFEWDRILRPGGIIWFELFYAPNNEMPLYVAVLDLFKYKRLYWNMSPKVDSPEKGGAHMYLNCVLEKPNRKDIS